MVTVTPMERKVGGNTKAARATARKEETLVHEGDAGARRRRRGMAGRDSASRLSSINNARLKMEKWKVRDP
jgi:hypothetical protein